ncbi:MAG: prolyl oligopeptidase family serine peptidase [Fimbriimonas sp.]|nr:prolyl oligopeptidase family serine peptidase [Fimbriimonas sp.]
MSRTPVRILVVALAGGLIACSMGQVKRTLKPEDFGQWEALVGQQISNDGHWLTYQLPRVDGEIRLVLKNSDGPERTDVPSGVGAQFSDDSKWCGYLIGPSKKEADKLAEEKKPVVTKFALKNLSTGVDRVFEAVQSFHFLKGSRTLVLIRYRGESRPDAGGDVECINLANGDMLTIGNVAMATPNDSGTLLAFSIRGDNGEKGVQLYDPATQVLRTLAWGKENVYDLTWARKADVLAFLIGTVDEKKDGDANVAVIVSDLHNPHPTYISLDPSKQVGFPKSSRIAEFGAFQLNEDGSAAAFGVVDWKDKKKPQGKPEDKPGVEIWNTKAVRAIPQQKVQAGQDKLKTALWVWHPKLNELQTISDGKVQSASLLYGFDNAVVIDPTPYQNPVSNGITYRDVVVVNTHTGHRTKMVERTQWTPAPSRKGKYIAYFERRNWWLYDIAGDKKLNMTGDIHEPFDDVDDDHTVPEKPPVAPPIWLANDDGVVLEDKYDCTLFRTVVNSATPLTNGRKDHEIFRLVQPDHPEDGPSLQNPFYFSAFDDDLKASGFYKCDSKGKGKMLIIDNAAIGSLIKAKDVDRMIFTMGSFEKSPNLFLTNTEMSQSKPESKTNPQQANFAWGKSELVTYKSRWGKELQGALIYPADYVKGRTYPMVTYIYERESNNLHAYVGPVDRSAYNPQVLSQNGYFVFLPDIAYRPRNPGKSALDCLEPAVDAVLAKHVGVDSTKIGLMGHSWGAYETAFVTTVSKAFAVGVAGAPLSELTSMYNSFYWNSGMTDQQIFETSQGRMEVPFWEDPKVYFDNSPVWQSAKRTTPILFTFGDQDGAVDWHQGQYLYNTLRRMGKPAVMLLYAGENHGLAKRANQLDYAHRVRHFLDVYLKNAKPEPWVTDDIPLLKQIDGP